MFYKTEKDRILILGGSGFIGHALYSELQSYFDVQATYCSQSDFSNNRAYHFYQVEKSTLAALLNSVRPSVIIAGLKGDYKAQVNAHLALAEYAVVNPSCSVLFLSSADVFSAKTLYPAYENDTPLSTSEEGKFKISVEKILLKTIPAQTAILRLPLILGVNSPTVFHLRQCIRHRARFEVFPNLVVSATTIKKVCQQIHYIINQSRSGIFHLASNNMMHHNELFMEITKKISDQAPIFKSIYSSNDDRYNAILPKHNPLPKTYQITIEEVIAASSLSEEIVSAF